MPVNFTFANSKETLQTFKVFAVCSFMYFSAHSMALLYWNF